VYLYTGYSRGSSDKKSNGIEQEILVHQRVKYCSSSLVSAQGYLRFSNEGDREQLVSFVFQVQEHSTDAKKGKTAY
jgi:hypothetical protein